MLRILVSRGEPISVDRCAEMHMRSVAITDHGNMFGAVQFYRRARERGVKPILGMEAYLTPGSRHDRGRIDSLFRSLQNVTASHLADRNLYDFGSATAGEH